MKGRERLNACISLEQRTSLIILNIPAQFTRAALLCLLELEGFLDSVDFLYLPFNFTTGLNIQLARSRFESGEDDSEIETLRWRSPGPEFDSREGTVKESVSFLRCLASNSQDTTHYEG